MEKREPVAVTRLRLQYQNIADECRRLRERNQVLEQERAQIEALRARLAGENMVLRQLVRERMDLSVRRKKK